MSDETKMTRLDPAVRYLVVNADDFGASAGVNRGIIEAHAHGVLTSTSLMVTGRARDEAVASSRAHPGLAVGLHFDVWGEDEREFDTHDIAATRDEFHRQLDEFVALMGHLPTHVDSHRHAHREPHLIARFREWVEPLGVVLCDTGPVRFVGGFYAQWEWKVTNLDYISVAFLQRMLREEVPKGVTELSCHPGYMTPDYVSVYAQEREVEIATLTDPAVRETIDAEGIRLISFADYNRLTTGRPWPA